MGIVKSCILFIAIAVSTTVSQTPSQLSSDQALRREIKALDLSQVTAINALTRTLNAAHRPGGIATLTYCANDENLNLRPLGPTLRDALDSIVVAYPEYRWYVDQGAINLVASNNELTLLDIVIADFKVDRGETMDEILRKLLATPEVKEGAARLRLSEGFTEIGIRSLERPGSSASGENKGFALHLRNTTVLETLNDIARAHGSAVWSYQEKRCHGPKEFSIRFLVQ